MKTTTFLLIALFSLVSFGQMESGENILIDKTQQDDAYLAGETIKVNAVVDGDLVIAGGNLTVNDSINGDLTAAGGELIVNGHIMDDVRIAVGRTTIDSEVGDDLIVFGGEVILTENAIVQGNLICFGGNVEIKGNVAGKLEVKAADVFIDGTIEGPSKIIGEDIIIGSNAKFYKGVEYYSSGGEINFNNALVNTEAQFNEDLSEEQSQLSLTTFGTKSIPLWVFYVLSTFLVILVLHALFKNAFSDAAEGLEHNMLKSFGFGLIYLIGIPVLILVAFLMVIGIPLGLFAAGVFVFSLLLGHWVAALMVVYYLRNRNGKEWGFWKITFLALLCAVILRLFAMIPYAGIVLSVIVLSITYGALTLKALHSRKQMAKN